MLENKEYALCGGTFFTLLLQARKQRTAARKNAVGEKDGLNDSDVLEGLIRVAFPDYISPAGRSIRTHTSSYKACRLSANEYLPFDKEELIHTFDHEIKETFSSPLQRMCQFSSSFIDEKNMGSWLIRAILDTISRDPSITDEIFYVDQNGHPMDKKHLLTVQNIELQPFLLGVWHFILSNRADNTVGATTIDSWHDRPAVKRARRKFNSEVGKNWSNSVSVHIIQVDEPVSGEHKDFIRSHKILVDKRSSDFDLDWAARGKMRSPQDEYRTYLKNTREKYNKLKTLLYNDAPVEFYNFYICNNIEQRIYIKKNSYRRKIIENSTAQLLHECSNFILISGTGGLGKSMMMRHLLLDSIERFDEFGKIPIFIPLKDYGDSYDSLLDYIFEKFEGLGGPKNLADLSKLLSHGSCLLLFDGLDEIKSDCRKKFEHDLEFFADKYTDNMFVISSRPAGAFISLHRFTVLNLCPFTKEQALSLIDKLDFRPDEPAIKANFRNELDNTLFRTHMEFTENPLLLTIMLMTYEQFAEIPSKMHIFYREAYITLSQKHDASKGAYKRVLKTGLTADRFADYFAEFCARSYRDEKFEFTDLLFDQYFNSLHERTKELHNVTPSDFRDDLVENMCLMFYENGKYHFTHRSFQEYFCALYFSKQKDKNLKRIGDFFENKNRRHYSDKAFNMLYDMIPEKIEEYIFSPFLKSLFVMCDAKNGYWTFLEELYPVLYYESGETSLWIRNEANSFIYNAIIRIQDIAAILDFDELPQEDEYLMDEWVYLDSDYKSPEFESGSLINKNAVPWEYKEYFGEPEVVGRYYEIDIETILRNPEKHEDTIHLLESDDFPIRAEFLAVRAYMQELIDKEQTIGDDLFDLFQ